MTFLSAHQMRSAWNLRLLLTTLLAAASSCNSHAAVQKEAALAAHTRSSDPLNLGFEQLGVLDPSYPAIWNVWGGKRQISLDTSYPFSGMRSLRIDSRGRPDVAGETVALQLPVIAAGKVIKLRGFIRTRDLNAGFAGFWLRAFANNGSVLVDASTKDQGVTGTSDWTPRELAIAIAPSAESVIVGLSSSGIGTAWFDSLSISIDGSPIQGLIIEAQREFTAKVESTRMQVTPLRSLEALASNDEWPAIQAVVRGAKVVALGEGTHGTREFFQTKDRIVRGLVTREQFSVFGIEANMAEARQINDYVQDARKDPVLSWDFLGFANRQETVEMIEWMREYNRSGKGRVEFWGFDCQDPSVAMDSVRAFVSRRDPERVAWLDSVYTIVRKASRQVPSEAGGIASTKVWRNAAEKVLAYVNSHRLRFLQLSSDSMEVEWATQYAALVVQSAESRRSSAARDSMMALNVEWILKHHPRGTGMVLWAHNLHVGRFAGSMGYHLNARYGNAQRVIAFALGDGEYTAGGVRGLSSYPAAPPLVGSVEAVFRATQIPQFIIDLRRSVTIPGNQWLQEPHLFREIGSTAVESGFYLQRVYPAFDAIIYFDHSRPTRSVPQAASSNCKAMGIANLWRC